MVRLVSSPTANTSHLRVARNCGFLGHPSALWDSLNDSSRKVLIYRPSECITSIQSSQPEPQLEPPSPERLQPGNMVEVQPWIPFLVGQRESS
jgi:hypothetical protein